MCARNRPGPGRPTLKVPLIRLKRARKSHEFRFTLRRVQDSNDDDSFSVNKESGTIAAEAKIGIPLPAGILGRNIDIGASGSHENAQKVSVKRVQNYLRENHNYVKWNGQKFVTKPMQGSVSFITS